LVRWAVPEDYQCGNPFFCISAMTRYTPQDFIDLVEKHRIPYHEKTLGQLFCNGSSQEIVRLLMTECERAGVTIRLGCEVTEIKQNGGQNNRFSIETSLGTVTANSLVMATGGQSIPTGLAYTSDIASSMMAMGYSGELTHLEDGTIGPATANIGVLSGIVNFVFFDVDNLVIDAAVDPGDSGGPVFNLDGEAVGTTRAAQVYTDSG